MAAYAATVTSLLDRGRKIDQVTGIGMFAGECNVSNYNTTLAEITGITGKFKTVIAVVAGTSDEGYIFEWVDASGAFKAYTFDYDAIADGPAIEAAIDTDVGSAHFIAIGLV